jgi:hypothetical protein
MKKSPYIIKELSIRKMPGFPSGMESLNDLAANVNIITGPNASGKSSTARAIQELIWHNNTKGLRIQGSVKIDNDAWEIDIDSGRIRTERNGIDEQLKGLPALEGHKRYLLALHNFVEGDENDLAKEIAKQSIGGFDLDAAQNELGYSDRIQTLGATDFKKFKDSENKYRAIREEQKSLKREEDSLVLLSSEKEKAELANKLNDFYTKVTEYLESKLIYQQLTDQINEFPESITKLTGNEHNQIQEYENEIEECIIKIDKASAEIEKSKNELKKLKISESGIEEKTILEIQERLEKLGDLDRNIADFKSQLIQEKIKEQTALNSVDDSIDSSEWKNLNIQDVAGLDKMLRDAHQVLGEKRFLNSETDLLEVEAKKFQKETIKSEIYTNGIKTLAEWLKEPIDSKGIPLKTVIVISTSGIIAAIATFFIGWIGILLGIALFVAAYLFAKSANGNGSNSLEIRENDFKKSGLKSPSSWDNENVANRIDELIAQLSDGKESERIGQRLKDCQSKLKNLQIRMDSLNAVRQHWIEKLQASPGFPESSSNDFSSLYWFLTHVKNWQEAFIQREALEVNSSEAKEQYENELRKINAFFINSNLTETKDIIEAKATFSELKKEESIRENEIQIIQQKEEAINQQFQLKEKSNDRRLGVFQTIGIDEKDKDNIQELTKQLAGFKILEKDFYSSEQAFLKQESQLQAHSLFHDYEEEIKGLAIDEAKEKANLNKEIASKKEGIQNEIVGIETLINDKKKGHELEDLLTEKEEALDELHLLYERNLASTTGELIISELKKETQNKNRPEVFKRANEIFNKITLGRYELKLNEKEGSSFEANDKVLKRSYNLSELSTGTRVQLLLSVRLAYVETVESSIKLPLLADELLANSDDERAKAIIEALIEISREGRQVFYFTAQADEVGKWMAHLAPTGLDHKVIQLNSKGNEFYKVDQFQPELSNLIFTQDIPKPIGKSHKEYGEILAVPAFNLLTQENSELHLWYLIEDLELLYSALNRGLKTWGQLESYHKNNGKIEHFDEVIFNQLSDRITVLNRFQELHKVGRSTLIDRGVLQSSGAITSSYIDRVSDKLNEVNNDPKLLLQALRNGEISRFRGDNADELEHYLLTERFIDDNEILGNEDIIIRMQALISNLDLQAEDIERFLKRI